MIINNMFICSNNDIMTRFTNMNERIPNTNILPSKTTEYV